jgi:hypothetical protein
MEEQDKCERSVRAAARAGLVEVEIEIQTKNSNDFGSMGSFFRKGGYDPVEGGAGKRCVRHPQTSLSPSPHGKLGPLFTSPVLWRPVPGSLF